MAYLPLRSVPITGDARDVYHRWLEGIDDELSSADCDRRDLCRRVLTDIYRPWGASASAWARVFSEPLNDAERVQLLQMDPANVTVEPEHYADIDTARYARVKPLLWMWEMFDRSPLGENLYLGVLFRRILARRIFRRCGRDFKAFHQVRFSFGYNMEVGDGVVVHRHVLLDDRGGIRLGDGASVSDYSNIYSHSHDVVNSPEITNRTTVVGAGVRIAYHATILTGVTLADDSMIGAGAVVSRDTEPSAVYAGIPAKLVRRKPDLPRKSAPPDPFAGMFNG
ncbi:MAG: acyltransferase [Gammaproteobacteria bacterium]|nr:acyltransferase [Gammaproteobacteria bacterium]MDE0650789.1 acyltransferase [Gammaproteobacteria bacterium]